MKTCPECKAVYTDDNLTTCPNDGAELTSKNKPAAEVKSAAPPKKGSPVLVLIIAGGLIFLAGIWWFSQKSGKNAAPVNSATNVANRAATSNNPAPETKPPTMTDVPVGGAQSPTEAYRMLFAAVKSQDSAKIKTMLSDASLNGLAQMAAGQQKKPVEEIIKNGFTETTFVDSYPQMRDERIKGNFGAVEVWNETRKQWDDIPFILENGSWKAAFGDAFANKWQSPGKGQATLEKEAANAKNPNAMIKLDTNGANTSGNFRSGGKIRKPKD